MYKPIRMTPKEAYLNTVRFIEGEIGHTKEELLRMANEGVDGANEILLSIEVIAQERAQLYVQGEANG